MIDAPEKIWVHYEAETDDATWSEYPYTDGFAGFESYGEYTRTDISQARIVELEEVLEQLFIAILPYMKDRIGSVQALDESSLASAVRFARASMRKTS
tara:strand:- start:23402 stop:23695 length:294 start_codon:yes stop_codon:yes gene_type:complete